MWFALPFPPSVNSLTFNRGNDGRGKTDAYRRWRSSAIPLVALAAGGRDENGRIVTQKCRVDGPYALHLQAGRPKDNRKRDLGNLLKAVEDALKDGGMIADDSDSQRIEMAWCSGLEGIRVLVLPTAKVPA